MRERLQPDLFCCTSPIYRAQEPRVCGTGCLDACVMAAGSLGLTCSGCPVRRLLLVLLFLAPDFPSCLWQLTKNEKQWSQWRPTAWRWDACFRWRHRWEMWRWMITSSCSLCPPSGVRALLRASGSTLLMLKRSQESEPSAHARGNDCQLYCDPEACACSQAGIKCQVSPPWPVVA